MQFVGRVVDARGLAGMSVLEVGSRDINGTPREFFTGHYWGVDMLPGPSVDQVLSAHHLTELDREFEVVLSTEMLEHDSAPWISLEQMAAVCAPDGCLIVTARGYDDRGCFPVHGFPEDHWRFSCTGMTHLLARTGWSPVQVIPDPAYPGVFAFARRLDA